MTLNPYITALAPEIALAIASALILWLGLSQRQSLHNAIPIIALVGLGVAMALATFWTDISLPQSIPALRLDPLTQYVRLVTFVIGVLIVLVNRHVPSDQERGEYFALLLLSLAGITLVAAADDLLLLFLAL